MSEESSTDNSVTCLIKILPPFIKDWADFVKTIAMYCFPIDMIPIKLDADGKIICDDGKFIITETPHTIQLVEEKTIQTKSSGLKLNIIFKIPIPSEESEYYDYVMDNIVNPLKYEEELTKLSWTHNGKHHFVIMSYVVPSKQKGLNIPDQSRFKKK